MFGTINKGMKKENNLQDKIFMRLTLYSRRLLQSSSMYFFQRFHNFDQNGPEMSVFPFEFC